MQVLAQFAYLVARMVHSLPYHRERDRRYDGFSLVEMLAAVALVAGTLAPAIVVMRDAMAISREAVQRNLVANYAVQVLEGQAASTMQSGLGSPVEAIASGCWDVSFCSWFRAWSSSRSSFLPSRLCGSCCGWCTCSS